jgi:hypothetical protein
MSALPPKADIAGRQLDVRFVPEADIEAGAGLLQSGRGQPQFSAPSTIRRASGSALSKRDPSCAHNFFVAEAANSLTVPLCKASSDT